MTHPWLDFLREDIWRVRGRTLPRKKLWLFKPLRVILLALRGFDENQCQLRASALTFYTLLSVVPVLAMAFGIAKGFGLQHNLESLIAERLKGQEQVVQWLIQFANAFLENTKGGVIAGFGVVLLFWSVVSVLGNIERSFNDIWGVRQGRSISRKFSDYLSICLIAPVLLMTASGVTVFMASQFARVAQRFEMLGIVGALVSVLLFLLPYGVLWVLFTFIYKFMPNARVSFQSALTAGVVAGTVYQAAQWAYVTFQIGVSKLNAVYGGFAALPLFLTWLQTSWLVVLFGAEVSFAVDNEETYEFERDCTRASMRFKRRVALKLTEICVKRFDQGKGAVSARDLAHTLEAPIRLVRELLFELVQAGILTAVDKEAARESYQPGFPADRLTVAQVLAALERYGEDNDAMVNANQMRSVSERMEALERRVGESPENALIRDL